ncbi:GNAT family N-acetyltransferase [Kribbella sp. GL6]|uniref:GNAT family N-acetyltransferase n=1 Tax=Kribbella sp. GL6 TaxID=3419765 RepID=UPI003D028F03
MNTSPFRPGLRAVTVSQVAGNQWHAVRNDRTVGRGYASRRLDGRTFLSIDSWQDSVFDRLAAVMLANQPEPVYTVVDEADRELAAGWQRAGFAVWRRESEYVVPGRLPVTVPGEVTITTADEAPLRELDRAIRAEVEAGPGWHTMPAEVLPWQGGTRPLDPARYTVAIRDGRYAGMIRLATHTRRPRIGLVAVLAAERRHGIARALLSHALRDTAEATAEVDETNTAALALFDDIGRRTGRSLELISGRA